MDANKRYLPDALYTYIASFIPMVWCKCPGRNYVFHRRTDEQKMIKWGKIKNGAIVAPEYKYIINGSVVVQCSFCREYHCYHCYEKIDGHECGPY